MTSVREFWVASVIRIIKPVLEPLSQDRLKSIMPIEGKNGREVYEKCTYLEALGRILTGIAPWLQLEDMSEAEKAQRDEIISLVHKCLENATDPEKNDYMNFSEGGQPIVDTAFLAQGLLRAPSVLWEPLKDNVKKNIIKCMKMTRTRKPCYNNWLLFSAMTETFLCYAGEEYDPMRIDYAVKQHLLWYKGDGIFSDGEILHCDYYNSFVIHPMLFEILEFFEEKEPDWGQHFPEEKRRLREYALILEKMISPEGTYPLLGRSLAYRFGVFHALALACYRDILGDGASPSQVRCALTAVIKRVLSNPRMFSSDGFLKVGILADEKELAEGYISTGSLYLCLTAFLPLGLSQAHPFWSDPDEDWSSKKAWNKYF